MSHLLTTLEDISTEPFDPGLDFQLGANGGSGGPFLTIFTRCCRRPDALWRNVESVLRQTSGNWEQLFVVDQIGKHDEDPVLWANKQFERYAHLVEGHYVYALDDDALLADTRMVEMLCAKAAETQWPEVLLVKMRMFNLDKLWRTHPLPYIWDLSWANGVRPDYWVGTGLNAVSRSDTWRSHLHHYQYAPGGDHKYISSLIQDVNLRIVKCDVMAAENPSRGCGVLMEKCKDGWFEPLVAQLELEQIDEDVWRLQA